MNANRWSSGLFVLFVFVHNGLFASLPTIANLTSQEDSFKLSRNGSETKLPYYVFGGVSYLGVDQFAQLANAQLRWQAVTEQVCLSNARGLLCFNWELSRVEFNGRMTQNNMPLRFENNQLYVPLSYVTSRDFQSFSDSNIVWKPKEKIFIQTASISLDTPQVKRMGDRYQMRVETPEKGAQYLIEKSNERLWIRFVRAQSAGSQVLDGDDVIREVKIVQRRHSADLLLSLGGRATDSDVYYDDDKKNLVIDVFFKSSDVLTTPPSASYKKAPSKVVRKQAIPSKKTPETVASSTPPVSVPITERLLSKPIVVKGDRKELLTIVIDAGHGGMDAGAIGPRGTLEKTINLEVAKALAKQLKKEKNVQVIMTRESDEFVPLNTRTDIANAANADLFVSIHCNSSLSSKSAGFETYFLSPEATDKAAEAVARLENSVVALEAKKGDASSKLETLLASMAVHDQINESSRFASLLVRSVRQVSGQDKAAVKEADFFVLRGAQMPAVLVELEYLSHPISESKLRSSRFQGNLVKGLVDGILSFEKQLRKERESQAAQMSSPATKTNR